MIGFIFSNNFYYDLVNSSVTADKLCKFSRLIYSFDSNYRYNIFNITINFATSQYYSGYTIHDSVVFNDSGYYNNKIYYIKEASCGSGCKTSSILKATYNGSVFNTNYNESYLIMINFTDNDPYYKVNLYYYAYINDILVMSGSTQSSSNNSFNIVDLNATHFSFVNSTHVINFTKTNISGVGVYRVAFYVETFAPTFSTGATIVLNLSMISLNKSAYNNYTGNFTSTISSLNPNYYTFRYNNHSKNSIVSFDDFYVNGMGKPYYVNTVGSNTVISSWCNATFLFSNKILKPRITYIPSSTINTLVAVDLYDRYLGYSLIPNNTPFFFKDSYFNQWFYVPALPCYDTNAITSNAYALTEKDSCQESSLDFGVKISLTSILYQNNNVTCYAQNVSSPYFISCTMNDTMNVGDGWKLELRREYNNYSSEYCVNTTPNNNAELRCEIDRDKIYSVVVYAKIGHNYYPMKSFLYSGGGEIPSLMFNELTYIIILAFMIFGILIFAVTPETSVVMFAFAVLFLSFSGIIAYSNLYIPLFLIIIVIILLITTKR